MRVIVLGAGAGGGFPQWNCGCANCTLVRTKSTRVERRTQDAVAISADGERFAVLNASPDILRQVEAVEALWPRAPRHSPIHSVVLSNGDMDHILGLFSLRESQPFALYATARVLEGLFAENRMTRTLMRFEGQVTRRPLALREEADLGCGLQVTAYPIQGKLPVHLEGLYPAAPEDNVALVVREPGRTAKLVYATACQRIEDVLPLIEANDTVLVDGTFASEDELVTQGLSKARAKQMAHQPILGEGGSLRQLSGVRAKRIIYTHINNTNPILCEGSDERRAVLAAGLEIAHDGMVLEV